jgi:phosphatidylserine/phosphatidylglycerophosphate/cardiolipin synthase-like enzyme
LAEDRHIRRGEILLAGPGRNNTIKLALSRDLKRARQVAIICACFLPPGRILRQMARLARRRLKVQLILPGKSDVFLSHLAALRKAFITALCGLASRRIGPKIGWRAGFWRIWTLTSPTNFLTWDKS